MGWLAVTNTQFTAQYITKQMINILTAPSFPEVIVITINYKHSMVSIRNSRSKLLVIFLTTRNVQHKW
jgi:hypothetical protein